MAKSITVVDFETFRIEPRPKYPPKPTSVSIIESDKSPVFLAWGHPSGNNCTFSKAKSILKKVWNSKQPKCFHNAKFDLDVAETHFGLRALNWDEYHDTMFLAFLQNPHELKLDLKTLADEYLDMPPIEQDKLKEWILSHVFTTQKSCGGDVRIFKTSQLKKPLGLFRVPPTKTGAFIAYAPGGLVGEYANGDTIRTKKLFDLFYPYIVERGMLPAYNRERQVMRPLLENERRGIKVPLKKLSSDVKQFQNDIDTIDAWLQKKLKCKTLEVDKTEQLADALDKAGFIDEWILTETGKRSMSKDNVEACIKDPKLTQVFRYRSKLVNSVRNFLRPWEIMARGNGGYISTTWNQVRQPSASGKGSKGARTGRLSSSPNFQNATNKPTILALKRNLKIDHDAQLILPKTLFKSVNQLPVIRSYIIPDDKNQTLINRDYSQQELRVLAHYEAGVLMRAYRDNPEMDIHELALKLINKLLGVELVRKIIKNLGFGLIYGMGLALLAKTMGVDEYLARDIKQAYLDIFPGLQDLIDDLMWRGKHDESIMTWGCREYFVEPPRVVKGRLWTFEYKMLNVLIQGSSADITKQSIINYDQAKIDGRFLMSVHDELMVSTKKGSFKKEMLILRDAMADIKLDVPLLSDGKYGADNWASMKKFKG